MASIKLYSVTSAISSDYSSASIETQDAILSRQAELCAAKQREKAGSELNARGFGKGGTKSAIVVNAPKSKNGVRTVSITFKGARTRGNTTTSNAAIAFFNEYGVGARMSARRFISRSNEEVSDECARIAADLFAQYVADQIQL